MYQRILIATDGTELAERALTHAVALARRLESPVTIVTVTELWPVMEIARQAESRADDPVGRYERMAADYAKSILDAAAAKAREAGVSFETRHVSDSHPADGIIQAAKEAGADLIVMASHGRRGIDRVLLGSEAQEVLTHSRIPVLIVR